MTQPEGRAGQVAAEGTALEEGGRARPVNAGDAQFGLRRGLWIREEGVSVDTQVEAGVEENPGFTDHMPCARSGARCGHILVNKSTEAKSGSYNLALPMARPCSKHFTQINSFTPHRSVRWTLFFKFLFI